MHLKNCWPAVAALAALAGVQVPASATFAQASPSLQPSGARRDAASPSTLSPFKAGGRYFEMDVSGSLQVRESERGIPRSLLPAGSFSTVAPSPNGKYLAYAHNRDAGDVRIRDVTTGRDLSDVLHHARISPAAWSHDNKGFLYIRKDSTDGRERVYYHGLGRAPSRDALILSQFDHPEWRYSARVSDDGLYAVFTISYPADAHTRIYFIDLADAGKPNFGAPVVKLAQSFDARYEFIDNAGSFFFLQTDRAAPLGQIVLANTDLIREARWPSVVPQTGDSLLFARTAGDEYLIAVYRSSSGASVARVYGPQDPSILRNEMRDRMDSLRKARAKDVDRRATGGMGPRGLMGNGPVIRLEPRSPIPVPAGAVIVAMNSIADDQQLFYTVKLSDGRLQSFSYDVTKSRSEPYPANQPGPAGPASPSNPR
jgi:prolyl oligopeptidase family protein